MAAWRRRPFQDFPVGMLMKINFLDGSEGKERTMGFFSFKLFSMPNVLTTKSPSLGVSTLKEGCFLKLLPLPSPTTKHSGFLWIWETVIRFIFITASYFTLFDAG